MLLIWGAEWLLKKITPDVTTAFKSALDKLAEQANIEPNKAIFSFEAS